MKLKLLFSLLLAWLYITIGNGQTNAPSIQTGVSFQWNDTQSSSNQSATIQSVTVDNIVFKNYGIPVGYELTQLGPSGHNANKIRRNGTFLFYNERDLINSFYRIYLLLNDKK